MKPKFLAIATALAFSSSLALAAPTWVDWSTTAVGTMGSTAVTLSGSPWDLVDGDYYYNNSSTGFTSSSGTYAGLMPSDLIRVDQVAQGGSTFTLSFSQAVGSLYMSLVSVGAGGTPVTYAFNDPFQVISFGPNYWGYGGYSTSVNNFTGTEYNGILLLNGNFGPNHPLTFTVQNPEGWHGFNVAAIPEPETYAMMLAGLGIIGAMARRRKQAKAAAA